MATCYKCGEEIEFYHNGFNAVPIHTSGSCSASGGSNGSGSNWRWVERETQEGRRFLFEWVEYPSYVNPNASCPRCGKDVYFYQSPSGGRVYFNELGPPWPKHGPSPWECYDGLEEEIGRISKILGPILPDSAQARKSEAATLRIPSLTTPEWRKDGWNPLLLFRAEPTGNGIIIDGEELSEGLKSVERKLVQVDLQDTFHELRGELVFSYSTAMNPDRLISVLTENVVFIRLISENIYEISTVSITTDNELIHFNFRMMASKVYMK